MRGNRIAQLLRIFGFGGLLLWGLASGAALAEAPSSVRISDQVQAQSPTDGAVPGNTLGNKSDADFWRGINHGAVGAVSIPDKKSAVMINRLGEDWRQFRTDQLLVWGGVLMGISLVAVIGFAMVYGKFKLHGPRTGRVIPRFSQAERWVHWFVACLFILLGLSGLVIMFGRQLLKPIIGGEALGVVANASLQAHNLLGPIFVIALACMLVLYLKDNIYQKGDFVWALKGGFFSSNHPPSWKYNLGEKSWYWLLAIGGTALAVSGVFLIFPTLLDDLMGMQLSQVVHAVAAVVLVAASIGHIYLGIWGVEGALDSMKLGYVDETWGLEHHRWWAEQEIKKEHIVEGAPDAVLAANKAEAE